MHPLVYLDELLTVLAKHNLDPPHGIVFDDKTFDRLKQAVSHYLMFDYSGNATTYRGLRVLRENQIYPPSES